MVLPIDNGSDRLFAYAGIDAPLGKEASRTLKNPDPAKALNVFRY
jgi:hypothetical protein